MSREGWQQALQEGNLDCQDEKRTEENILNFGLDDGSMQLLYEDDIYYIINYNEWGSGLHFINIIRKDNYEIIHTIEV